MPDQNPDPAANPVPPVTSTTAFPPADVPSPVIEAPVPPPPTGNADIPPAPPIIEQPGEAPPGSAAPSFDISTPGGEEPKKKFGGKRVIATILGLLVLVGGLGAGIILVRQQQDIRQRAQIPQDGGGGGGTPTQTPTATRVPTPPPSTPTQTPSPPPANDCTRAGGQCYTAPNCTFAVGTSPVNGGSGCGNVSQVCCQPGGVSATPTPPPCTSGYQCQGIANQNECVLNRNGLWQNCSGAGGTGTGLGTCCVPTGATATPTSQISCTIIPRDPASQGYCDRSAPNTADCTDKNEGSSCSIRSQCGGGSGTCVVINQGGANSECQCQRGGGGGGGGGGTGTPTPTVTERPGGGVTAQCFNIRAFDTSWNELSATQLTTLKAGDKVRFAVGGNASSGSFDKARFKINGADRPIVTTKRPASNDFYDEYTVPAGVTTFTIRAQIHHSSLGWSK